MFCIIIIYTHIDVAVNSSPLSELAVFEEYYALLYNTIADVIDPLMKVCVEEKLLTSEEKAQIVVHAAAAEKLKLLLLKISSSLKAGDTRVFYLMLTIMRGHGGKGTQTLADHIINRLKISTDQLPHVYIADTLVQYDRSKDVSVSTYVPYLSILKTLGSYTLMGGQVVQRNE